MAWEFTDDVAVYAERVWDLLAARPAVNTVALTVIEHVRAGRRWSPEPMLFGWYDTGTRVAGAVSLTPPYELLLAEVPTDAVVSLARAVRELGVELPGVHAEVVLAESFAAAWTQATGVSASIAMRQRLYQLQSVRPAPSPPGQARQGRKVNLDVAVDWYRRFQAEIGGHQLEVTPQVLYRIERQLLWLWELDSEPVALAARNPTTAGVARLGPVYTPPKHRRHGYGQAVTTACTSDALSRGASHAVLFTDLANPTSNSIYQRIGYTPVSDYQVIRFTIHCVIHRNLT
nr:GNAT family N-acetyltransferase [Actinomycetota bacterium]